MRRALASVLLLLALGLVWTDGARAGELQNLVDDLGAKDWKTRRAAYVALVRRRDPRAIPLLRRAIPKQDDWGQRYGTLLLNTFPYADVKRTWKRLLGAESTYVRFVAANAMVREGDDDAILPLIAAIKDPKASTTIRLWMIAGLTSLAPPPVFAALRTTLSPKHEMCVVAAVVRRMNIRRDPAAKVAAVRMLADPRPEARVLAAAFLVRMGDTWRAGALATAIKEDAGITFLPILQALLDKTGRVPSVVLDAALARLEKETVVASQVAWIALLARYRHMAARPTLRRLLLCDDPVLSRAAFDALVVLAGPLTGETLDPLLETDDIERRLWAAEALRRRDDPSGLAVVVLALQQGTEGQRVDAARILGGFRLQACVEPLLDAMAEGSPGVRAEAGRSLDLVLTGLFPYRTLSLPRTGWAPTASEEKRREILRKIRTWWQAHRSGDW